MTELPLVSVIMNCLNGERYLKEAIDSAYAQTYPNWEIIFWDNGSTDQSGDIARSYDARLRYFFTEETVTLGTARNRAIEQARGDFYAFLDCDDVWLPKKLEFQVRAMISVDCAACYGSIVKIDSDGREIGSYMPREARAWLFVQLLRNYDAHLSTWMLRRSALVERGLRFDPQMTASEDYCLLMHLAVDSRFCVLAEPLAKYRIHNSALTNRSIAKWADEREYTLRAIEAKYPSIRARYGRALDEAYARAAYYRARYLVSIGNIPAARAILRRYIFTDYRYFLGYVLLFLPKGAWDALHRARTKRVV